jgi:hypothetical protein
MKTPVCCRDSVLRKTIRLDVEDGGKPERAVWRAATYDELGSWNHPIEARFCPFCGKSLPEMQRMANPPSPLCVIEDGGYRCSTCGERLNVCECHPPEDAFAEAVS